MSSYTINFTHRGLDVDASIDEHVPGSRWIEPEGGTCDRVAWDVEDIEEVLMEFEFSQGVERMVLGYFKLFKRLPQALVDRINREWDLEHEATDYFWYTLGGPSQHFRS